MAFQGFPDREQLRRLKSEGIFSWSSLATRCGIAAAVCAALVALWGTLPGEDRFALYPDETTLQLGQVTRSLLSSTIKTVICSAVAALLAGLSMSFIQTRGAYGWAVLRTVQQGERCRNPLRVVASMVVIFSLASCLLYGVSSRFVEVVRQQSVSTMAAALLGLLVAILKLMVVASLVLAVVLVFVNRAGFLLRMRFRSRRGSGRNS